MSEDSANISITLSVQIGSLDRDVVVTLSSINGTAMCKYKSNRNPLQQLVCHTSFCISSAGEEYAPAAGVHVYN